VSLVARLAARAIVDGHIVTGREEAFRYRDAHPAARAEPAERLSASLWIRRLAIVPVKSTKKYGILYN
jgi:hypothetical protein